MVYSIWYIEETERSCPVSATCRRRGARQGGRRLTAETDGPTGRWGRRGRPTDIVRRIEEDLHGSRTAGAGFGEQFCGKGGKLWLTFLILSPVFAAAFAAFAVIYADDGLLTVIGCCGIAAVCLFLFGVCIATARRRTSVGRRTRKGCVFFALGRQVAFLRWEEMREAGFLRLEGEKRAERLRLYWSSEELRGAVKGGKFAGREVGLGANRPRSVHSRLPRPRILRGKGRDMVSRRRSAHFVHARPFPPPAPP